MMHRMLVNFNFTSRHCAVLALQKTPERHHKLTLNLLIEMIEDTPTVFVIPPPASLECPLHKGILCNPVETPCGCTFCREYVLVVLE